MKAAFLINQPNRELVGLGAGRGQLLDPPQRGRLTSFHTQWPLWPVHGAAGSAGAAATHTGPLGGRSEALRVDCESSSCLGAPGP